MTHKRSVIAVAVTLLVFIALSAQGWAAETSPANSYSGDFWTRSTLTGDWGGVRNDLAKKGLTFDLSLTQVYQGIVGGGKDKVTHYGGRGDLNIHADTGKLGLWPGGFLAVEVEGNYNKSVNGYTGALMPTNNSHMFPRPVDDNINVPAVNFTQFLSPYFAVMFGKFATLTSNAGDMNEFAHGKGDTQFMNMAFNLNPVVATTIPYSALGAGAIVLPTKNPHDAIVSFMVMQTNGQSNFTGFSDLNQNLLTFVGEGRVRTDFFALTGHHLLGVAYSNKEYGSIDQNARVIIQSGEIEKEKGSWNIHYNFDQYLYEPKKGSGQGIGIFGRFGASDGNPNFLHYFYSIGIGGKGVIPGRPLDQFGMGYYYQDVKSPTFTGPFATRSFLRDEQGFEAYYNMALTPWLKMTPNVQVVRGAQKNTVSVIPGGIPIIVRSNIDTATVLGVRLQMVF
jgi:porin